MRIINIKTKINLGFMGIFVIMLFTTIYLIFQIQKISDNTSLIYEHPLKVSNTIREIKMEINKCEQFIYQVRNAQNSMQLDSFKNEILQRDSLIKLDFKVIYTKYLGDIHDVDSAYESYNAWEKIKNDIFILKKKNNTDSIDLLLKSNNQLQIKKITFFTNRISDFAKKKADITFSETIKAENKTYYISIILIIVTSLVVIFFAYYLSKNISKPIQTFVNEANLLFSEQSKDLETKVHKEEDLFGITINELRKSYLSIEQQNLEIKNKNVQLSIINDSLEKKVKLRTIELQNTIEQLEKENTERKLAEIKVSESENKFQAIFRNNSAAIAIIEPDTTISMVNDAYCKMGGFSKQEITGTSWTQQIPPNDLERLKEYNRKRLINPDDAPDNYEFTFYHKNGEIKHAMMSVAMTQNKEIIASFVDISERIKAEEQLQAQNILFKSILNSPVDLLVFSLDKEYCYTAFNEKHREEMKHIWNADIKVGANLLDYMTIPELKVLAKDSIDRTYHGETFTEIQLQPDFNIYYEFNWNPIFRNEEVIGTTVFIRDITKRMQMEEAVRSSEEKFRAIFENMAAACCFDKVIYENGKAIDYRILDINSSYEKILKISREDVIGKLASEIYKTKEIPFFDVYARVAETGIPETFESFFEPAGIYLHITASKPAPGMFSTIFSDITERKHADELLQKSEEKYRLMFANNPQPMWIYDLETLAFLEVNDAAIQHYGYSKEEFLSMTLKDIRPKEDIDALLKDVEMTKRIYNPAGEWRHLKKNGELMHVIIISHSVTFKNRKARHVIVNDITERKKAEIALKESEEKFVVAFMTSPYAITITRPKDGKFIEVNDAFLNLAGYTKEEVLNNASINLGMWVNNEERDQVVKEIMNNGKIYGKEIEFKRKNGEIMTGLFSAQLIRIKNDPFILSSINDITERKKAENELKESEKIFSEMFHKSPVTITLSVPYESTILDVNETFLKDMEYSRKEVIGHTLLELGIFYDIKDRENLLHIINEKGFVFGYECRFKSKSGKILSGLTSIVPIKIKGKVCQLTTVINITDRKLAEQAVQERDTRFRKLSSQVPGMIYQFMKKQDGTYCVPYASDGIRSIFGCSPEEVSDSFSPITNVILPEDLNKVINTIEFSANQLTLWQCEYRVQLKGEPVKWLLGQSMPEKLPDGCIVWHGFNTDITNSKKAAEALKQNEAHLNTLIDTIPDLVWLKDEKGVFLQCNKRFENLFGAVKEEIIGKTDYDFLEKEMADFFREKDKDALGAGKSLVNEEIVTFANDGHSEFLETIKTPIYTNDKQVLGVLGIGRDITKRKQDEDNLKENERKLREAQELAHLGFWSWNIKTGKVEWSDEVFKIFGLDKENFTPQIDSILALSPWPEDHQRDMELINRATDTHQPGSYEQKFLRPDQSIGHYFSTFQGIYNDNNELISIIGTVLDITERKKVQEEILKMNETLEQKVKIRTAQLETAYSEMEAFSYSVSHDLRSPLRAIDGFSKILLENSQTLDEEALRLLNIICQNSANMSKLIEDLITYAKVGKANISISPANMKGIVKSILNDFKKDISKHNIAINITKLPDVKGDVILFNQIWTNLIRNAIKYTAKSDNPEIEIGGHIETKENEAVFYIKDNGVGFNMQYVNKLFRVFERLHTSEEFEGTGIGLAIVKKAVNRHGGRVWAESVEGKGASFYFTVSLLIDES